MRWRPLAVACLLACAACGPPRVEAELAPIVLAAPDCEQGPTQAGWLIPSQASVVGGQPEFEPLMQAEDYDKWPAWTSGARSWVLTIPPAVAAAQLDVVADPNEVEVAAIAVQEPWDPGYRPAYAQIAHRPGQSASIWVFVDLEAWCQLERRPAEAPVWISSDAETKTLWIELE